MTSKDLMIAKDQIQAFVLNVFQINKLDGEAGTLVLEAVMNEIRSVSHARLLEEHQNLLNENLRLKRECEQIKQEEREDGTDG